MVTVDLPLPDTDEFENCCDPDGNITDKEAVETAILTAIPGSRRVEVFVYGKEHLPAKVFIEISDADLVIEGFEDDE